MAGLLPRLRQLAPGIGLELLLTGAVSLRSVLRAVAQRRLERRDPQGWRHAAADVRAARVATASRQARAAPHHAVAPASIAKSAAVTQLASSLAR